jgi:spore coat protein A
MASLTHELKPHSDPALLDPRGIAKFVNPLPNALDPSFIYQPVAGSSYDIGVYPIEQDLGLGNDPLTGVPIKTKLYGYGTSAGTATYPGRSFVVDSGSPISVTWRNELWSGEPEVPLALDEYVVRTFDSLGRNVAAVDYSLFNHDAMPMLGIPIVTHLHGGHTESASDGLPGQWYTPPIVGGAPVETGPDYVKNAFVYDNDQQASSLWYHDHAMGTTRLAAYAGQAGFYIIRDEFDTGDADNAWGLPFGRYEIPIAVQDKMFTSSGELFYPTITATNPDDGSTIDPSTDAEMFGDTIIVNGKAWPFLDVEPRKYRFRLLNGSDSRFYNFFIPNPNPGGGTVPIVQIGTEQGVLDAPVMLKSLVLAPGQRADVVIDFSRFADKELVLRNNAKTPFPKGSTVDPLTTGQIMQFRVGTVISTPDNPLPATLRGGPGQPPRIAPLTATPDPVTGEGKTRKLGLFEVEDDFLRITPMLGTVGGESDGPIPFMAPTTEKPLLNDTEIWEVYNATVDGHPIHLHLVSFQVVSREKFRFALDPETGGIEPDSLRLVGRPSRPQSNEGWQDTVQMFPGEVTRIIAKFDRPGAYVWHCHILSHEEHDMMRPFEVVAPPPAARAVAPLEARISRAADLFARAPLSAASSLFTTTPGDGVAPITRMLKDPEAWKITAA